jgi:hypothetical protein
MKDLATAVVVLALLSLLGIWVLALVDVLTRRDLPEAHKALLSVAIVVLVPVSVLYVLGRPVSAVRRARQLPDDWRNGLVSRIEGERNGDGRGNGGHGGVEQARVSDLELAERVRRSSMEPVRSAE